MTLPSIQSPDAAPVTQDMAPTSIQRTTTWLGNLNTLVGVLGFFGPAVTGNDDCIINIRPGKLLGLATVNWLHSLMHLPFGLYGRQARHSTRQSRIHMYVTATGFGMMSCMALRKLRGRSGYVMLHGMAIDRAGTGVHLAWTGIALAALHKERRS